MLIKRIQCSSNIADHVIGSEILVSSAQTAEGALSFMHILLQSLHPWMMQKTFLLNGSIKSFDSKDFQHFNLALPYLMILNT